MASTYSDNIAIELVATGEQAGSWGSTTNQNWKRAEEAISAYASVPVAADTTTLNWTLADATDAYTVATTSDSGSSGRAAFVDFINSGGGTNANLAVTVLAEAVSNYPKRVFFVRNSLTGGAIITLDVGGNTAAEKVAIQNGASAVVYTELDSGGTATDNIINNLLETFQVDNINTAANAAAVVTVSDSETSALKFSDGTNDLMTLDSTRNMVQAHIRNYAIASDNVAIGDGTLVNLASGGDDNTAVGSEALTALTTGHSNTAIGSQALKAGATSYGNTAIGYKAAFSMENAGHSNVAIGSAVSHSGNLAPLENVTTAHSSIGIGAAAVGKTTTISGNIGIGTGACGGAAASTTTGGTNVCIGFNSGNVITEAANNTMVGSYAGNTLLTGDNNVLIGISVDTSATDGDTQIVIGNSIEGTGDSEVTIGSSGNVISADFTSSGTWTQASDSRFKKDVNPIGFGLDFINDLNPVEFYCKQVDDIDGTEDQGILDEIVVREFPGREDPDGNLDEGELVSAKKNGRNYGFIAQEVKAVVDTYSDDGFMGWSETYKGVGRVGSAAFVTPLVKAVQELTAQVTALEARISDLESS